VEIATLGVVTYLVVAECNCRVVGILPAHWLHVDNLASVLYRDGLRLCVLHGAWVSQPGGLPSVHNVLAVR